MTVPGSNIHTTGTDWNAGDLAMCIREGSWIRHGIGPRLGQVLPVAAVIDLNQVEVVGPRSHPCYLEFKAWGRDFTFGCENFTKIEPLSPAEHVQAVVDLALDPWDVKRRHRERAQ